MKKVHIVLLLFIFIGLALNVQAANVFFDPSMTELKVMPGETGKAALKVTGSARMNYSLSFKVGSKFGNGNIPPGWLIPADVSLTSPLGGSSTSTMDLVVNIPPDAEAGTYSGQLLPEDLGSSERIISSGVTLSIEVAAPRTACSGLPEISAIALEPFNVWAPTDRDVEINISGAISVAEGCEVTAWYTMQSNNGPVQGDISIGSGGVFEEKAKVNVSRSGTDKFGRVFNGTVFAEDAEGNQNSVNFSVTVLHDRGNKLGKAN
jgi:hypothetical protein